jgi:hypothetical protein
VSDVIWAGAIGAGAAILASALTGYISRNVQDKADRQQDLRDTKADERNLRSRKADRLRDAYVEVVVAADTLVAVANAIQSRFNESEEQQRERLTEALTRAHENLDRSLARLRLETGTEASLEAFVQVRKGYNAYMVGWDMKRQFPAEFKFEEILAELRKAEEGAQQLEAVARRHLDELEKPI